MMNREEEIVCISQCKVDHLNISQEWQVNRNLACWIKKRNN